MNIRHYKLLIKIGYRPHLKLKVQTQHYTLKWCITKFKRGPIVGLDRSTKQKGYIYRKSHIIFVYAIEKSWQNLINIAYL